MCEPISTTALILGIAQTGLGIASGIAGYQQAQANIDYQNAVAEQNYQFQLMQTSAQRNFEQMRYDQQEALIQQTRMLADKAYSDDIAQLNLRLMQEQEAAAQQRQQGVKQGLQARGEIAAAGRIGNTIDNLVADYYRQQATFDFNTSRNLAFTGAQIQEQKRGAAATYASRIGSQQAYIKQPVLDPLKPIPQAGPSAAPYVLGAVAQGVSGFSSAMTTFPKAKPTSFPNYSNTFR